MTDEVLLIGLGELGVHILNFLARTSGITRIVAADVNEARGFALTNQAIYGASYEGFYPDIKFLKMDLMDVDGTVEILREVRPKVICSSAVLWTRYLRMPLLSEEKRQKLKAMGHAARFSVGLALPYRLMQVVRRSGIDTQVISTVTPDVNHPILGKIGLAPTVGGGNAGLRVPWIQKIVSEKLKVPMRNVFIYLVAHHSWGYHKAPFWIKILVEGNDVTSQFPPDRLHETLLNLNRTTHVTVEGPLGEYARFYQQYIASAYLKNILAIYFNTGEIVIAPGPVGLPGGYPVRLSSKGAEVVLPEEITLKEAIRINEEGARYDDVDHIKDDGTVVCTDGSSLKINEVDETAKKFLSIIRQ